MVAIKSVEAALAQIKSDTSKILDLTVGKHKVTPGQVIPKAGELQKDTPQLQSNRLAAMKRN